MKLSEFDFDLPERLIATRPVRPRPAARMLVAEGDAITDAHVADLPGILSAGDLLVLNDTRVIPARLTGRRIRPGATGAKVEVTLLTETGGQWRALAKPAAKLRAGDRLEFGALSAGVTGRMGAEVTLRFDRTGPDFDAALAEAGAMPLPPYIAGRRAPDARDRDDYQSVFARHDGSVAAPTASLHFDAALLARLAEAGIGQAHVTLHVGAGTFLPVTSEDVSGHRMHAEWGRVGAEAAGAINAARAAGGRIIPVGTTALRLIETAADGAGVIHPFEGETDIFIRPGHRFRAADALMTNFHLPRSTLLMLVAALMGLERVRRIYAHAVAREYRFFSYGDASLLIPPRG